MNDPPLHHPSRRKRLSRREQKQRKKQKQQSSKEELLPSMDPPKDQQDDDEGEEDEVQVIEVDNSSTYVPTPIPTWEEVQRKQTAAKACSLGKWFPKATVIKSLVPAVSEGNHHQNQTTKKKKNPTPSSSSAALVLFYQYVEPPWPESKVQQLLAYLQTIGSRRVLGGRIRVAREGVNATVSSVDHDSSFSEGVNTTTTTTRTRTTALSTLRAFCKDLQHFDSVFDTTDFKFLSNLSPDRHFPQLKLFPVQEIVYYGISADQAPLAKTGVHLKPKDFHAQLEQQDAVVIDVRNHYEAAIGRFDGQQHKQQQKQQQQQSNDSDSSSSSSVAAATAGASGASYIDPKMRKSTDFASWLETSDCQSQLEDKTVLLFCTGGVRCERASAYLNTKYGDKIKGVYQLQGGIEAYLKEYPNGGYWRGKNFVFDKRESVSADNPNGDGGVLKKHQQHPKTTERGSAATATATSSNSIETHCCICETPWDRYLGKKKCAMCGVPVLVCDACLESPQRSQQQKRCPLCVEQNVTVPAEDVEWTDNGKKVAVAAAAPSTVGNEKADVALAAANGKKVAPSVLKWGGGHAAKKRDKRRFRNQPCRFGASCTRPDCFFAHHPNKKGDDGPLQEHQTSGKRK